MTGGWGTAGSPAALGFRSITAPPPYPAPPPGGPFHATAPPARPGRGPGGLGDLRAAGAGAFAGGRRRLADGGLGGEFDGVVQRAGERAGAGGLANPDRGRGLGANPIRWFRRHRTARPGPGGGSFVHLAAPADAGGSPRFRRRCGMGRGDDRGRSRCMRVWRGVVVASVLAALAVVLGTAHLEAEGRLRLPWPTMGPQPGTRAGLVGGRLLGG